VKKIFHDVEMATFTELADRLEEESRVDRDKLQSVLDHYVESGMLEQVSFTNKEILYRWTESRDYPNGVITRHIRLD
jgi:Fe2+ or Zn2+ uptake regulation protein